MARGDQSFLPLGSAGAVRRLPMREEAAPPPDPDKRFQLLYAVLAFAMSACTTPEELAAWATENRQAFDELATGSPARVERLRKIYALHRDNLRPAAVDPAALNRPMPALDRLTGQEGGGYAGTED